MKKFLLGAIVGIIVYKVVRAKKLFTRFATIVIDKTIINLKQRANANGVSDSEMAAAAGVFTKAFK